MSLPDTFNRTVDSLLAIPAAYVKLAGLFVCVACAGWWIHGIGKAGEARGQFELRDSLAAATTLRLHRQKDAIGAHIDTVSTVVTRTTRRVDSLWVQVPETLVTPADTTKALNALPELRRNTAEAIAACTEFQISCADYRRVADSLEYSLRTMNEGLRKELSAVKPGKLAGVVKWVGIIGAFGIGFKLGRVR